MISEETPAFEGIPILVNQKAKPETVESLIKDVNSLDEKTAVKVVVRWRHERMEYPGWLVPTDEMRMSLWRKTSPYISKLFELSQNWPLIDQALLCREVVWRVETSMLPLDTNLKNPLDVVCNGLFSLLIDGSDPKPSDHLAELLDVSEKEVLDSWLEITYALLRDARESFDANQWNSLIEKVSQVVHHFSLHVDKFYYEQALWLLWNLERNKARNLLTQWQPSHRDPLAMMWKAGMLFELDDLSESLSLLRAALQEIRRSFHRTQGVNIDLLSLEGWCTYLLMPVEFEIYYRNPIQNSKNQENYADILHKQFLKRWDELKAWDSDPWLFVSYFDRVLSGEPPASQEPRRITTGFDLGHYKVTQSLILEPDTKWLPAFACLRMIEKVGIPPTSLSDTLQSAAKWLFPISDFWSTMLLVRSGNTKAMQEEVVANRTQIASMNSDLVHRLNTWAMNALNRELPTLGNPIPLQSNQTSLLETLIEFLSRLSLKLEEHDLQSAFQMALQLHNLPGMKSHIRLNESCAPWLKRLFGVADNHQLLTWLPDLIRFPLPGGANEEDSSLHPAIAWPDPMKFFPAEKVGDTQDISANLKNEAREAIDWLLRHAQAASGQTRQKALMRLILVFHTNLMSNSQEKLFSNLIWENTTSEGLPDLPELALSNILHLPSPPNIEPKSILKQHLLTLKPIKTVSSDSTSFSLSLSHYREDPMIFDVSHASKPVVQLPTEPRGGIEWESTEINQLWEVVYEWWENDRLAIKQASKNPNFAGGLVGHDRYVRFSIERIGMLLSRVVLPKMDAGNRDDWTTVLSFLSETRQDEIFLTPALPYVLLRRPDEHNYVLETIHADLSSENDRAIRAAAEAITHWAFLGDETDVVPVPSDVVNNLINRVIFRQAQAIISCLNYLTLIIKTKPNLFDTDQMYLVTSSLIPWEHATRIPVTEENASGFPEHDRPLLRVLVGRLASAISDCLKQRLPEQPEPPDISQLRKLYSSDSLPEVRLSFGNG